MCIRDRIWAAACCGPISTIRASTVATPSSPTTTAASSTRRASRIPRTRLAHLTAPGSKYLARSPGRSCGALLLERLPGRALAAVVSGEAAALAAPLLAAAQRWSRGHGLPAPLAGLRQRLRPPVEALPFVVVDLRGDAPGQRPALHRRRVGAEQLGDLFEGEQPLPAQARAAVLEPVGAPQRVEDLEAEAFGDPGAQAGRIPSQVYN